MITKIANSIYERNEERFFTSASQHLMSSGAAASARKAVKMPATASVI
jgi:hypothetical protein